MVMQRDVEGGRNRTETEAIPSPREQGHLQSKRVAGTVKLGYNELGYNEHIFRTNWLYKCTNEPGYNEPRL
jgi:hypothetical protein